MATPVQSDLTVTTELKQLLEEARGRTISEEEFQEQRISFAYGNAMECDLITKDSVRQTVRKFSLK